MATKKTPPATRSAARKTPTASTAGSAPITIFSYAAASTSEKVSDKYADGQQPTMMFGPFDRLLERRAEVSPDKLKRSLTAFVESMDSAMAGVPDFLAGFKLEEIELSLEVGAEGEIGLLGTGGKLSGKGSITLKLKKP